MRKFPVLLIVSGFLAAAAAHANEMPSLFFTPQEIGKIEASPGKAAPIGSADIHLGAVLYYGPNKWSVWLDNAKWTPDTRRADVAIIEVRPELVRLVLHGVQQVALKPHQTFQAATGEIVEGSP